jgi:hypothetical protein
MNSTNKTSPCSVETKPRRRSVDEADLDAVSASTKRSISLGSKTKQFG